jgi:hypothetical protein
VTSQVPEISQGHRVGTVRRWPLLLIAAPAAVAIWSGWVGLGGMCGFGEVQPFPGIVSWHLDTAITLPVGVESYGAYALASWLSPAAPAQARRFAKWSALGSLALGALGQVAYHLLAAAHRTRAPWPVVVAVACLPVVTLGFAAALTHLQHAAGTVPDGPPEHAPPAVPATGPVAPGGDDETGQAEALGAISEAGEPEAPDDETAQPASAAAVPGDETGNPRPQQGGDELARLFAEQMDQARGLPPHGSGTPEITPEAAAGTVRGELPPAAPEAGSGTVPGLVPYDAESAALIALRATMAAGNALSQNKLIEKFGLTRAAERRVRNRALAQVNGHELGKETAE